MKGVKSLKQQKHDISTLIVTQSDPLCERE